MGTSRGSQVVEEDVQSIVRGVSSRPVRTSLLLAVISLVIFNANLRPISIGDTFPARYIPFGIWRYRTVLLDPIVNETKEGKPIPYWILPGRGGHAISLYPVVVPIVVAPLYLPAVAWLQVHEWKPVLLQGIARLMEKFCASLIAAMAVALIYLLLRRRAAAREALLLTLAFALGTSTWMIGSQALWQHGFAELLIVLTLLLLTAPCTSRAALAVGFLCGLIVCNRAPDGLLAAGFGIYGLWWARRRTGLMIAAAIVPVVIVVAYNLETAGNVIGAAGLVGNAGFYRFPVLSSLAGLLFSPTRGLFVFSPFLLFLPFGLRRVWADRGARGLTTA